MVPIKNARLFGRLEYYFLNSENKQRHVQKTPKLSALGQNTKKYAWILVVGGQAEQRNAIAYQAVVLS